MRDNAAIAALLEELADVLAAQHANPFRISAYREAAQTVRKAPRQMSDILAKEGEAGLHSLPGIGESLALAIKQAATSGHLGLLTRLRGETPPESMLMLVPSIGPKLAHRIHEELGVSTVDELERAIVCGRIAQLDGLGAKRLRALEAFFRKSDRGPTQKIAMTRPPTVAELLSIDSEYRTKAAGGSLPKIAPHRYNQDHKAWLPILHTERGDRHFTALFSNTARAHELGKTHDWVIIILDDDSGGQWTVVTASRGSQGGRRVVRGREQECGRFYTRLKREIAKGRCRSFNVVANIPAASPRDESP